ncbi:MAG: M15 family metallopeptidase [Bacteroidota bacterium]
MKGVGTSLVAKVGKSRHQQGFALDFGVNAAFYRKQGSGATDIQKTEVGEFGKRNGWGWQYKLRDYPHFELDPLDYGYSSRAEAYEVNKQYLADFGGEENIPIIDLSTSLDDALSHANEFKEYWAGKKEDFVDALSVTPDQLLQQGYTPDNYLEYYEKYATMFNIASSEHKRHSAVVSALSK